MKKAQIDKIFNVFLNELEFVRKKGEWHYRFRNIILILKTQKSAWDQHLYVHVGLVFTDKVLDAVSVNYENSHLAHDLDVIAMHNGYVSAEINQLFSIGTDITQATEKLGSIRSLIEDFLLPLIGKYDNWNFLKEKFKTKIALNPWFVYYFSIDDFENFFHERSHK
jgi:hypothetical protein